MKELSAALVKAQSQIKSAIKDTKGQIGQNKAYKYADLATIWDACKKALHENGIAVVQKPDFSSEDVWLETILMHSSGEWVSGRYPIRPTQNTPQAYGSALTYARRYSLSAMVGVVTEDDDGSAASADSHEDHTPPERPVLTVAEAEGFANDFAGLVATAKTNADIDAIARRESKLIAELRAHHPDLYESLQAIVKSTRANLAPKVAAE